MSQILVDSNVLVYAINRPSPKHTLAQKFLQENIEKSVLAQQNILETFRVLTHPKFSSPMNQAEAIEAVMRIADSCEIITPDYKTHEMTLELVKKYQLRGDQIYDAYLVATALVNDVVEIATDNTRDFAKFESIKQVNPFLQKA